MDLSPNDIRNYEFPNQMRGYDKAEVDNFLEQVAVALEEARQQNLRLSMEVDSLKIQLAGLKEFEDTIKNAAIDARRNADSTKANARKEAEKVLIDARKEAEEIIASNQTKIAAIKEQMIKLEQTKRSYISELRAMMNSHIELVDEIATADIKKDIHGEENPPVAVDNGNNIEVTESEDVTRQTLETLSGTPGKETVETEEANAPGEPIPVAEHEDVAEEEKPVDPELVAALEQYKKTHEVKAEDLNPEDFGPAPPQGQMVETDKRAEDVPPGFIAQVADAEALAARLRNLSKGKAPAEPNDFDDSEQAEDAGLAPDAQDSPTEHNAIDMDRPTAQDRAKASVSPEELAKALDSVVSKFEEEMDKAEKR